MTPHTPAAVVSARGVAKRYGADTVFANVSLDVAAGEFVAIVGDSGVGKSTLLNGLAGLDTFDEGRITLCGQDLSSASDDARALLRRQHVGFVFQAFHVLPHLDVAQNVALPLMLLGQHDGPRVSAMLAAVGLLLFACAGCRTAPKTGRIIETNYDRAACEAAGLLGRGEPVKPVPVPDLDARMEEGVEGVKPELLDRLDLYFGDQVSVDGDRAVWRKPGKPYLSAAEQGWESAGTWLADNPQRPLETAAARGNAVQQMTAAFELNLTAMSLLAMVVGIFLIYNTVTFSVVQRRSLFGVLRCLGVTRGQLFTLILGEAALFSLVGSLLGLALGVVLGRTVVGLITQTINDFYFVVSVRQISLSWFTLAKGMLVGVASALLASALPAWEAMATPPQMTLQRSSLEASWQRLLPWFLLAALFSGSLGVLLLRWDSSGLVPAFAGVIALLMGAALLMPPVLVAAMQGLGWASRGLPVVARLAPRDILRSLSRTAVAVAALMVAVSVIVGLSIMIGSFRGTVVTWLDQTLQADLFVSPPSTTANRVLGKVDPAIVSAIAERPDLRAMVTYNNFDVHLVDQDRDITLIAAGGDVSAGRRPYAWIRPGLDDPFAALEAREGVILSEAVYLRDGQGAIPEQVRLESPDGERSFPVIAVFYDYSSDRGSVLMDRSQVAELWHDDSVASLGLFLEYCKEARGLTSGSCLI
jgi:ABC-type sugar transport system ATPase subunit